MICFNRVRVVGVHEDFLTICDGEKLDIGSAAGFPPDEAERLFERFYRVGDEMVRRTPGSGLGLNIVQRYLSLDGGSIEAASDGPGAGAVFTVVWRSGGTT